MTYNLMESIVRGRLREKRGRSTVPTVWPRIWSRVPRRSRRPWTPWLTCQPFRSERAPAAKAASCTSAYEQHLGQDDASRPKGADRERTRSGGLSRAAPPFRAKAGRAG
jgi:hypothetical protein